MSRKKSNSDSDFVATTAGVVALPPEPLPPQLVHRYRTELARLDIPGQIQQVLYYLTLGYHPVYAAPLPGEAHVPSFADLVERRHTITAWEPVGRPELARYSLLLKTATALLGKMLPDLKSIEVVDETTVERRFSDLELAQRITGLISVAEENGRAAGRRMTGRAHPTALGAADIEEVEGVETVAPVPQSPVSPSPFSSAPSPSPPPPSPPMPDWVRALAGDGP